MSQSYSRSIEGPDLCAFLARVCAMRTQFEAQVGGESEAWVTRARALYAKYGHLEIEPFGSAEKDGAMQKHTPVEISFVHEQLPYRFRTLCLGIGRGIHFHVLALPERIEVVQRRAHYRAEPPGHDSVQSEVQYRQSEEPRDVETVNLSVGGILIYDKQLAAAPEPEHPLTLHLVFDEGEVLRLSGTVRHSGAHPILERGLCIGVQFRGVTPPEEASLTQIVMRWQRERRRGQLKE